MSDIFEYIVKTVFDIDDIGVRIKASDEAMANGHTRKERGFGQDQIDW